MVFNYDEDVMIWRYDVIVDDDVMIIDDDNTYIRSIEIAIVSSVQPALDLTMIDNFDEVLNQTLESITDEQDQAAFNVLTDFFIKKESGLHKEVSNDGSCSLWVSKESKQEFLERGLDAIKIKVR